MQETETNTTRVSWEELEGMEGETDWERLRNMTEEEIEQNARDDPDAQQTDEEFWQDAEVVTYRNVDTLLPEGRRFSLLPENLESTELNPDTFPDLKTAQRAFFGTAVPT